MAGVKIAAVALLVASLLALTCCDDPEVYMDAVRADILRVLRKFIAFCHGYMFIYNWGTRLMEFNQPTGEISGISYQKFKADLSVFYEESIGEFRAV